jgi:hypothetical protein
MQQNFLTGTIPSELGQLRGLSTCLSFLSPTCLFLGSALLTFSFRVLNQAKLFLESNTLTGTVPTEIGLMEELGMLLCIFLLPTTLAVH